MPVEAWEGFGSGETVSGARASHRKLYFVKGTADEEEARDEVLALVPATYTLDTLEVIPRRDTRVVPLSTDFWQVEVSYGLDGGSSPQAGQSVFAFEIMGETQHITHSLETVGAYGTSPPDYGGAIGVTRDGIEGVDIIAPTFKFTETHYIDDADVDNAFKATIYGLVGKVNDDAFKGLAAGECMFLGVSGSKRGDAAEWELTYHFVGSPNKTGLEVGAITGIDKQGHEYLWIDYAPVEDGTANVLVQEPRAVYVERVADEGDFSTLGIGV